MEYRLASAPPPRPFTIQTLRRFVLAFFQGFVDSFKFHHLLSPDFRRFGSSCRSAAIHTNLGYAGSSLAKKRALLKREQQQDNETTTTTTTGGGVDNSKSPRILERTLKCCLLNGCVFWTSIFIFESAILPLVERSIRWFTSHETAEWMWKTVFPILSITFATLWVLPFYLLSKFVNAIWFADIADTAYRESGERPRMMSTISVAVADTVFSIVVETIFLFQAKTFSLLLAPLPLLGATVNLVHLCMLHSLYCFEYKWFNQGMELHKRLAFIENNWPYFLGFGLPLAALTNYPSNLVVSGCVFAIFFPLFIVSGNSAQVITTVDEDVKLRIFHPTIIISNSIFTKTFTEKQKSRHFGKSMQGSYSCRR